MGRRFKDGDRLLEQINACSMITIQLTEGQNLINLHKNLFPSGNLRLFRWLFLIWFWLVQVRVSVAQDQLSNYYATLSSADTNKINSVLQTLQPENTNSAKAFTGALLMRKAGLLKSPKKKLEIFKQGKPLLEEAIEKENQNAEFRFLRLIIQENSPAILKYHHNIKEDSDIVKQNYKNFSPGLKHAVQDYARNSKTLSSGDFSKGVHNE